MAPPGAPTHPNGSPYGCCLSALTRFGDARCAGSGRSHRAAPLHPQAALSPLGKTSYRAEQQTSNDFVRGIAGYNSSFSHPTHLYPVVPLFRHANPKFPFIVPPPARQRHGNRYCYPRHGAFHRIDSQICSSVVHCTDCANYHHESLWLYSAIRTPDQLVCHLDKRPHNLHTTPKRYHSCRTNPMRLVNEYQPPVSSPCYSLPPRHIVRQMRSPSNTPFSFLLGRHTPTPLRLEVETSYFSGVLRDTGKNPVHPPTLHLRPAVSLPSRPRPVPSFSHIVLG